MNKVQAQYAAAKIAMENADLLWEKELEARTTHLDPANNGAQWEEWGNICDEVAAKYQTVEKRQALRDAEKVMVEWANKKTLTSKAGKRMGLTAKRAVETVMGKFDTDITIRNQVIDMAFRLA